MNMNMDHIMLSEHTEYVYFVPCLIHQMDPIVTNISFSLLRTLLWPAAHAESPKFGMPYPAECCGP